MSKQFVADLKDKDLVKSVFLVSDKNLLVDRKGNQYLNLNLSDKSGGLNARMWDKAIELAATFDIGDFVEVKGHVQTFQGKKQIVIHDLKKIESLEIDLGDYVAKTSIEPVKMLTVLLQKVESLENKFVKALILKTLNAPEVKDKFLMAPAAKTIHHARVGGLLEHILSIAEIMEFFASHYPFLNRDLLIFGAIFHDLGKVYELKVGSGIQYTDEGRLVGHMSIAIEMIDTYSADIEGFPKELKDSLKHLVLSHHGKLEYGSPKRPKFLEAVVVSMVDDLDSKVDSIKSLMMAEINSESDWTSFNPQYDRYFYLKHLRAKLK